ncbi:MAG: hypothetical protein ACRDKU_00735 [Gaiellaceae bacterium]
MRKLMFIAVSTLAAALLLAAPAAFGGNDHDREVLRTGKCSGASTWKLKAELDDGLIETEFEVDQNRVGRRWRVTIVQNGRVVFGGIRRTTARSGSFEARRLLANRPGADRIVASARALAGGETCRGALSF